MEHPELEALLDKYGPHGIAEALAEVCRAKAEHVRSNWQDEPLAKAWERNAKVFDKASGQLTS